MKLSLSKISFVNIIVIILVFSMIISLFIYKFTDTFYEQKVLELEKNYYNHNKTLIHNEIERGLQRIKITKKIIYEKNEYILKAKVNYIHNLLSSENIKNSTMLIAKYTKELNLLNWNNKAGYFYIFNSEGNFLYYGGDKKFAKKNVFELGKSNKNFSEFIQNVIQKNETLGSYKWQKPDEKNDLLEKKYVYVKKDVKHDIFIAVGMYAKNIDNEIKHLVFNELKKDKFGDDNQGYFWIFGLDKIMKMHPTLEGKKIDFISTLDGEVLVDVMIKKALNKGGYVNYKWLNPDTNKVSKKTSYVRLIPDSSLIIGAGFHFDELKEQLSDEKEAFKKLSEEYLQKIYFVLSILIIVTLLVARYLSIRISKIETDQENHLHLLEQYRHLLDESSLVSRTDHNGVITYVNESFEKVSGYSKKEIIGQTHSLFKHPDTPKSQFQNLWNTIHNGEIWKGILKNKRKNGESYYASLTIIPIKNKEGEILRYISSAIDITKHIKNKTKLKNLFKTDSLTGLGNRVSLLNYINKNSDSVLSLIDIDRFKEINDSFSHEIGDKVIKEFGLRLFNHFQEKSYFLYRVQADVFAIVNNEKSVVDIKKDIEQFMQLIGKDKYEISEYSFPITYTCGIASNKENLFAYTGIALREAKDKKFKILEYDSSLNDIEDFKNNIQWVDRINKAISDNNVVPHFQPIYNYKTGKIDKYEALMRIVEDRKIIYPNDFLDIAKKTKLYPELTYKMITKVLDKFSLSTLEFSLNLCIEDLMNRELTTFLYDYAKKKNVFNRMVLEIVESEEMEDNIYISEVINKFKSMGTKISIDDFGSGYSNYEYLISLQADYLKIDGSITKLIVTDSRTLDVVKSIVEFAKKSNIKIIAEFVSDEEIDKILRDIGVDYAQGFYYGKPQAELV
jgi:PAS domain S-box-containing protein/diguanylate cyclase (GGDEF)-like protein